MARKTAKMKAKTVEQPSDVGPENRLKNIVAFRGTGAWSAWLRRGRAHVQGGALTLPQLIELAVGEYLAKWGFTEPAPPRVPDDRRSPTRPKS